MVCGAAGSRATQPVTVAPIATRSIAAAVNGTRIAKGYLGRRMVPSSATTPTQPGICRQPPRKPHHVPRPRRCRYPHQVQVRPPADPMSPQRGPRPRQDPADWLLHHGGMLVPARNGSSGSRSKCTRRPLRQRTGGVIPSGDSLWEPRTPIARPVVCTTDCTTGPVSSSTGLASVCTAAAALPGKRAPARTVCATPLVTPPRTVATPGIFTESPFNYRYRA